MRRASGQLVATRLGRVGVRAPLADAAASPAGMPPGATGQADAEVLRVDSRPAAAALPGCRGVPRGPRPRDEAGQPTRRRACPDPPQAAGSTAAQPDVQRLARQRADCSRRRPVKNRPANDTVSSRSITWSSSKGLVEHRAALPRGTGNSARSSSRAGCRPKTGRTRPGARAGERREAASRPGQGGGPAAPTPRCLPSAGLSWPGRTSCR